MLSYSLKLYCSPVGVCSSSKWKRIEALANSGLPTPRCDILEVDDCTGEATRCCAVCQGEARLRHTGEMCRAAREVAH
jgi:hypothetical protein